MYDDKADPQQALDQAIPQAQTAHKRILLEVGGDWCIWCHKLHHFFDANSDLNAFMDQYFITVKVNHSPENENTAFLSQYPEVAGYPHLFVLESDGTLLHSQNTGDLEEGDHHDRDKVAHFLKAWAIS
jgi:thiol:disulfide interchange protein